jgi:hypothetical protein
LETLLALLLQEATHFEGEEALSEFAAALQAQVASVRAATRLLMDGRAHDPQWPLRVADDYLRGVGFALLAWAWARTAHAAIGRADDNWYRDKLTAARFGVQWLLPEAELCWRRVRARDAVLPAISA